MTTERHPARRRGGDEEAVGLILERRSLGELGPRYHYTTGNARRPRRRRGQEAGQTVRLSKRAGRIITLVDIIKTVGTDVARFFYLHKKADAHLDFDLELALKHTDENPVYYIQYAYVRTKSILEKATHTEALHAITTKDIENFGPAERLLLKKIASLKEQLQSIQRNYQTHQLAYYTIELAQTFHAYYSHHKVIDTENIAQSRARLVMIDLVRTTLKTCFDLLGISAPDRM